LLGSMIVPFERVAVRVVLELIGRLDVATVRSMITTELEVEAMYLPTEIGEHLPEPRLPLLGSPMLAAAVRGKQCEPQDVLLAALLLRLEMSFLLEVVVLLVALALLLEVIVLLVALALLLEVIVLVEESLLLELVVLLVALALLLEVIVLVEESLLLELVVLLVALALLLEVIVLVEESLLLELVVLLIALALLVEMALLLEVIVLVEMALLLEVIVLLLALALLLEVIVLVEMALLLEVIVLLLALALLLEKGRLLEFAVEETLLVEMALLLEVVVPVEMTLLLGVVVLLIALVLELPLRMPLSPSGYSLHPQDPAVICLESSERVARMVRSLPLTYQYPRLFMHHRWPASVPERESLGLLGAWVEQYNCPSTKEKVVCFCKLASRKSATRTIVEPERRTLLQPS